MYMLNQAQGYREILAKQLNISQQQMTYLGIPSASYGGDKRDRTADLLNAIQVLGKPENFV